METAFLMVVLEDDDPWDRFGDPNCCRPAKGFCAAPGLSSYRSYKIDMLSDLHK